MHRQKPHVTSAQIKKFLSVHALWTPKVENAFHIANKVHGRAKRDDGTSYLTQHIFPIVKETVLYFSKSKRLEDTVSLAFIHDVLEDNSTYSKEDLQMQFGEELVTSATYLKKPRQYIEGRYRTQKVKHYEHKLFVEQLESAPFEVKVLKCLDRINNLICTDVKRRPKQYERFVLDTQVWYLPFAQGIDRVLYTTMKEEVEKLKEALHLTYNSKDKLF